MTVTLEKFFQLGEYEKKFHPLAVKKYREFLNGILKDVPLDAITENDMKESLSKLDYFSYESSIKSLREWLKKCLLTNDASSLKVYPYSFPVWGIWEFKDLLMKVYQKKRRQENLKEAKANARFRAYQNSRRREREWEEAKVETGQWLVRVNKRLDTLKANLNKNTMPEFQTPVWLKPYSPSVWAKQLPGPTKDWFTAKTGILVANYKLTLEEALRDLVDVKSFFKALYVPAVQYEAVSPLLVPVKGHQVKAKPGIPCLNWRLATYIISLTEIWLAEGNITDTRNGYDFQVHSSSEKLGTVYSGPEFWKYQDAFVTPISLLALLAWGGELSGVETVKRDAPWTSYRVEGFPDKIILNDDFVHFVRDMAKKQPLDQAFLSRGMCDTETAGLIKAKLEKLQKPEAPAAVLGIASEPESKTGDGYTDVVYNLTHQMGYKDAEAKAAAKFACEKHPNGTVLEKITTALQSLGK